MDPFAFQRATRKPKRLSVTVSDKTYRLLLDRSDTEGRSTSNLAAYLLEQGLDDLDPKRLVVSRDLR